MRNGDFVEKPLFGRAKDSGRRDWTVFCFSLVSCVAYAFKSKLRVLVRRGNHNERT